MVLFSVAAQRLGPCCVCACGTPAASRSCSASSRRTSRTKKVRSQAIEGTSQRHAAPGAVRRVGPNPILWREISTRAYGRRPLLVKTAYFLVLAFIC